MEATDFFLRAEDVTTSETATSVHDVVLPSSSKASQPSYVEPLGYFTLPFFVILGLCGNLITLRVMLTREFFRMPVSRFLIVLALSDSFVLCLQPFNKQFVMKAIGQDIRALSETGCKLFFWLWRMCKFGSSWVVVLIACERFVAVWLPVKAKQINTKRNAAIALVWVYAALCIYIGWGVSFADRVVFGNCIPNTRFPGKVLDAGVFIVGSGFVYAIIPSVILAVLNALIIYKLIRLRKQKTRDDSQNKKQDARAKTTVMLISVTISFIILINPISTSHLVAFFNDENLFQATDKGTVALREITQIMELMNYSTNFLLYTLCGKRFREKAFMLMGRGRCGVSTVTPSDQGTQSLTHSTKY